MAVITFFLACGMERKKMEQATGYDLLKAQAAFRANAREQRAAQAQDWLSSLLEWAVCLKQGMSVCRCKSSTRKSYAVQASLLIILHCLQS